MEFELWLESEHVEPTVNNFCNVLVTLSTGEEYALNVWTFAYFEVARNDIDESISRDVAGIYLEPPDLFVADLTRTTLSLVVRELVRRDSMPRQCLVNNAGTVASESTPDVE